MQNLLLVLLLLTLKNGLSELKGKNASRNLAKIGCCALQDTSHPADTHTRNFIFSPFASNPNIGLEKPEIEI